MNDIFFYGGYIVKNARTGFGILLSVFGVASMFDCRRNIQMFGNAETIARLDWYNLYVGSMLGGFTAWTAIPSKV